MCGCIVLLSLFFFAIVGGVTEAKHSSRTLSCPSHHCYCVCVCNAVVVRAGYCPFDPTQQTQCYVCVFYTALGMQVRSSGLKQGGSSSTRTRETRETAVETVTGASPQALQPRLERATQRRNTLQTAQSHHFRVVRHTFR